MSAETFDSNNACNRISAMWLALAEQIAGSVPDILIADADPARAVRWATCAEACFWQATGESASHDVKDIAPLPAPEPKP